MSSQYEIDNYEQRERLSKIKARALLRDTTSNAILHLTINTDNTYSIVGHIVCEMCDYCYSQGDCRCKYDALAQSSKFNIYENQIVEE